MRDPGIGIHNNINSGSSTSISISDDSSQRMDPMSISDEIVAPGPLDFEVANPGGLETETEATFTWRIDSWRRLKREVALGGKVFSEPFLVGTRRWRMLACTTDSTSSSSSTFGRYEEDRQGSLLSLYVGVDEGAFDASTDWAVCARILLAVLHPRQPEKHAVKIAQHRFDASESDWGFSHFIPTWTLSKEYCEDGDGGPVTFFARVRVIKDVTGVLWHNFVSYNSKRVTGYVGLQNQGATCYMNSLLQSLYQTHEFRKATFMIPTENDRPTDSIPLGLQRLFYRLQTSDTPPNTTELTRSFGWDSLDAFMQHDVQEFSRVLLDELEGKMKGTQAEGTVARLFGGNLRNVIRCLHVPYQSVRVEDFYDIQLTIRGVRCLADSFERYIQAEQMIGDNKYRAEGYGLQDACRFVVFEHLPPVLHLHLERYTFDPATGAIIKVNDRFDFPTQIDLTAYLAEDSPDRQSGQPMEYELHSVLVHSGDSHGGHYCVFIRESLPAECAEESVPRRWLKFDDTRVVPVTEKEAVQDNFGGAPLEEEEPDHQGDSLSTDHSGREGRGSAAALRERRFKRFTNAYMLVYVRRADVPQVLAPVDLVQDIPAHLRSKIQAEQAAEAQRRAERHAQMTSLTIHLYDQALIADYPGFDLFDHYDFVSGDHRKSSSSSSPSLPLLPWHVEPRKIVMKRDQTVADLLDLLSDPSVSIRLWTCAMRRNGTVRFDEPLLDPHMRLGSLLNKASLNTILLIFKEESPSLTPITSDSAIIYFKFWDPNSSVLIRPLCPLILRQGERIGSCIAALAKVLGDDSTDDWMFWEEIKPGRIDKLDPRCTIKEAQLQNGDIICFQRGACKITAADYLEDLLYWTEIALVPFDLSTNEEEEETKLFISMAMPYQEAIRKILECLGLDADRLENHLRLFLPISDALDTGEDNREDPSEENPSSRLIPLKSPRNYPVGSSLAKVIQTAADAVIKPSTLWWRIESMEVDSGGEEMQQQLVDTCEQDRTKRWINLIGGTFQSGHRHGDHSVAITGFYFDAEATVSQLTRELMLDPEETILMLEIRQGLVVHTLMPDDQIKGLRHEKSIVALRPLSEMEESALSSDNGLVVSVFAYQRPSLLPMLEGGAASAFGFPNILIVPKTEANLASLRRQLCIFAGWPVGASKRIRLATFYGGTNWAFLGDSGAAVVPSLGSMVPLVEATAANNIDWSQTALAVDITDLDLATMNPSIEEESSPPAKRLVGPTTSSAYSPRSHSIKIKSSNVNKQP